MFQSKHSEKIKIKAVNFNFAVTFMRFRSVEKVIGKLNLY